MGKKNITYGMFFPGVSSIHTYFMKESIDVIGLNDAMIVTSIYENVYIIRLKCFFHRRTIHFSFLHTRKNS